MTWLSVLNIFVGWILGRFNPLPFYAIITPIDTFEIYKVFENITKMEHLLQRANAPFSIIFSKVFKNKTLLKFFLNFFNVV